MNVEDVPFRKPFPPTCLFDGCDDSSRARGLCWGHLAQLRQKGELKPKRGSLPPKLCAFPDCGRKHNRHGWCDTHATQAKRGSVMVPIDKARRTQYLVTTGSGYVKVYAPEHPNAQARGYVMQHILVMSALLGRPLTGDENVHHINGDRADNRPDNLELWSTRQPKGQRVADKVQWAIQLLRDYAPETLSEGARHGGHGETLWQGAVVPGKQRD